MVILLDMDGVLADTDAGFVAAWQARFSEPVPFEVLNRTQFFMSPDGAATTNSPEANEVFQAAGFWRALQPKKGALEAVAYMRAQGHEVFILTSAGIRYPRAASEKYEWVSEHFGAEMVSRLVITPAKHIVNGDVLIDDRPELAFEDDATWEHVLFNASYNYEVHGKQRLDWDNYKEVLSI